MDLLLSTELVSTPHIISEEVYHPRFQLPPLDVDLLYTTLDNKPVVEPTAEELAAYHFLKNALGEIVTISRL